MKHLPRWILSLVAIAAVASLTGAWTNQDGRKNDRPEVERVYQSKKPKSISRSLKQAAILRALPTFKVTLIEAIQLAEKELGGKAVSADIDVELPEGKPEIHINLFVGDKFTAAKVDPMTKKVTLVHKAVVNTDGEENEGEEEEEEEGG